MKKRIATVLLMLALLLTAGCGGEKEKLLSAEGVPQEALQSAVYKAALAEENATVIAYGGTPLTAGEPVRAAVDAMRQGKDAVLTYYDLCGGEEQDPYFTAWRLTMQDGVLSYQSTESDGWDSAVDWQTVLYRQAGELRLNSCGYLSFGEELPEYGGLYRVFSPLDGYEDYDTRCTVTEDYLEPLGTMAGLLFETAEEIEDPRSWQMIYDFLTGCTDGCHEGGSLPTAEVVSELTKRFDITAEALQKLLDPTGSGTVVWEEYGGVEPLYFAGSLRQEGDLLYIRYGLLPTDGTEPTYDRELTVRQEGEAPKYISNRVVPVTLENGITALNITELTTGSEWRPLGSYRFEDGTATPYAGLRPRLLEDGTYAVPAVKGSYEDGKPIAVLMVQADGSRRVIETPLICGALPEDSNGYNMCTESQGNSLVIFTEKGIYQNTSRRRMEVRVWSDGRMEQGSGEWLPGGTVFSPDGQHSACRDDSGSLLIDGVPTEISTPEQDRWDVYADCWLDNDRLVLWERGNETGRADCGVYILSTGTAGWLGLAGYSRSYSTVPLPGDGILVQMAEAYYDEDGNVDYDYVMYDMPQADFPNGEWSRTVTDGANWRTWQGKILWGIDYTDEPGEIKLCAYDAAAGKTAGVALSFAELGESSWYILDCSAMEQGLVLQSYQYQAETDWLLTVPQKLLENPQWQRQPDRLDTAEEVALTEIEETFGGRWQENEDELVIYREGDTLYSRWADEAPQELVKAYRTGKTGYYIVTRWADGTADALALDTGKPKDNKIYAMLYWNRELEYRGEA